MLCQISSEKSKIRINCKPAKKFEGGLEILHWIWPKNMQVFKQDLTEAKKNAIPKNRDGLNDCLPYENSSKFSYFLTAFFAAFSAAFTSFLAVSAAAVTADLAESTTALAVESTF